MATPPKVAGAPSFGGRQDFTAIIFFRPSEINILRTSFYIRLLHGRVSLRRRRRFFLTNIYYLSYIHIYIHMFIVHVWRSIGRPRAFRSHVFFDCRCRYWKIPTIFIYVRYTTVKREQCTCGPKRGAAIGSRPRPRARWRHVVRVLPITR